MRLIVVGVITLVAGAANAELGDLLCVTDEYIATGLEVKAEPSADAETVMVIGAGHSILEFGREDGWLWGGISDAGGREGYVPLDAVSDLDLDGLPCSP